MLLNYKSGAWLLWKQVSFWLFLFQGFLFKLKQLLKDSLCFLAFIFLVPPIIFCTDICTGNLQFSAIREHL